MFVVKEHTSVDVMIQKISTILINKQSQVFTLSAYQTDQFPKFDSIVLQIQQNLSKVVEIQNISFTVRTGARVKRAYFRLSQQGSISIDQNKPQLRSQNGAGLFCDIWLKSPDECQKIVEQMSEKYCENYESVTVLMYSLDLLEVLKKAVQQLKGIFGADNEYKFRFKENIREPTKSYEKRAYGYTFNFK